MRVSVHSAANNLEYNTLVNGKQYWFYGSVRASGSLFKDYDDGYCSASEIELDDVETEFECYTPDEKDPESDMIQVEITDQLEEVFDEWASGWILENGEWERY